MPQTPSYARAMARARRLTRLGCAALALCLAALPLGCARTHDYVTGEATFNRYSLQEEIELGSREATLVLASAEQAGITIDPDRPLTRAVRTIVARILAVPENRARMPALPWEVHVVDDPTVNAWTFPGGQVLLMAGLFDSGVLLDEDEAAAAIGHELAHAAARHGTERRSIEEVRRWLAPFGRFLAPRLVELAAPERPRELLRALGEGAAGFSRAQELEADLVGLELMTRAGYDPAKALGVWRRLAAQESSSARAWRDGSADPDHDDSATHPAPDLRLRELERHLPVARYLRARQVTSAPERPEKTAWHVATSTRSASAERGPSAHAVARLPEAGPLVAGAHVPTRWVRPPPELLALEIDAGTHEDTAGPIIVRLTVRSARELHEDQLRFSAMLIVEPSTARSEYAPVLHAARLAEDAPLAAGTVELHTTLPGLHPGRYRIRARTLVGALWAEETAELEVPHAR